MYLGSLNCHYKLAKVIKLEAHYFYSITKGFLVYSQYFTMGYIKKKTLEYFYKVIKLRVHKILKNSIKTSFQTEYKCICRTFDK